MDVRTIFGQYVYLLALCRHRWMLQVVVTRADVVVLLSDLVKG
jgi:hypothetical protein